MAEVYGPVSSGPGPVPSLVRVAERDGRLYVAVEDLVHWLRRRVDTLDESGREVLNETIGKIDAWTMP